MNGDEATKNINVMFHNEKVKRRYRPLIVCISGYEDPEYKERAKASGMKEYLVKPISAPELTRIYSIAKERQRLKAEKD